jgi:hypothetical protein
MELRYTMNMEFKILQDYIKPIEDGITILNKKFTCTDYSIFPIEKIREPNIVDVDKLMKASLNNAHDEKAIYVGFLKHEGRNVDMFILHTHFEESGTLATSALTRIMLDLEYTMSSRVHIELWDNFWQKLLLHMYSVPYDFTKKTKELKNKDMSHYKDKEYEKWVNKKGYTCKSSTELK